MTWHNDWWRSATTSTGGKTYRLHTYSTDPDNATDQRNTTALNAFAIWAKADDGTPRVHGLGAMEAYVRLPRARASEFYLAQIDAEHAGKTMVIRLWDPGDTGALSANLQILRPDGPDYEVDAVQLHGRAGLWHRGQLRDRDRHERATSVTTNTGGTSLFNGCWLTIEIPLRPRTTPRLIPTHGQRHHRRRLVEDPLQHGASTPPATRRT